MNELKGDKNYGGMGIGTGGISILAIFVVLCLTTLATLSIVSARADYVLTQKTVESNAQYYTAQGVAEEKLALIEEALLLPDFETTLQAQGLDTAKEGDKLIISFTTAINERKYLKSVIEAELLGGVPSGKFKRLEWKPVPIKTDEAKQPLNVFK